MLRWLARPGVVPAAGRWGATQGLRPLASVQFTCGLPIPRQFSVTPSPSDGSGGSGGSLPQTGTTPAPAVTTKHRWLPKWMLKESIVAGPEFSRWRIAPASMAIHLCIGSVYAWSIFNTPLTREFGVVASSAADWSLGSVVPIFSTAIVCLGLSAAVAGKWLEEVGPRAVGLLSAVCFGGGFAVASLGLLYHSLPLVYAGYGVLGEWVPAPGHSRVSF